MLIEPYNKQWITQFQAIKTILEKSISISNYTIEHVGSTAVPELAAKPIIDIDIVYTSVTEFEFIEKGLLQLGYYNNGNQGIPDRTVFKRASTIFHEVLDTIPHHLYVCSNNSAALERHILLRNHLRENATARAGYQEMKVNFAIEANQNRKLYQALKEIHTNPFIDQIIEIERTKK